MSAPTRRIALNAEGLAVIEDHAAMYGLTLRQYMEALMHYAISTERRPGSWEGSSAFEPGTYYPEDSSCADRWFT